MQVEEWAGKIQLRKWIHVVNELNEELKTREGINHSSNVYAIDAFLTEDEIDECLRIMSDLSKQFRHKFGIEK